MAKAKLLKKSETMRQQAARRRAGAVKPRRRLRTASRTTRNWLTREYYLPLPDTNLGRWLNTRRYVAPQFLRNAFAELKAVTWPTRRETWQLTLAVFIFALVFGLMAAVVDYGLDKLFKRILLSD